MQTSRLNVSIVIPAYNEQDHLLACLEAIDKQTVKPLEVIVVDNNSSDKTAAVAEQFSFVTLVNETKQGVVNARDLGFNLAQGDIIGRIDADTLIPENWVAKLEAIFSDDNVDAVSGSLHFYDIGLSSIVDSVETYWRGWMARRMELNNRIFLLGANMAIRKSAWQLVRKQLCHTKGTHEDLDLALHMSEINQKVIYDSSLLASLSARRIDSSFAELYSYALISPHTYAEHNAKEYRYMYPIIVIVMVNYLFLRLLFRIFDPKRQGYSLRALFTPTTTRVNPATYV